MESRKRNMTEGEFWTWFDSKLIRTPTGCMEWSMCRSVQGYGFVQVKGKNLKSHRLSLERQLGRPISPTMSVLHSCNNPPCCNPEHLREGTHQENMDDKLRSGRQPRGETNGRAKLTLTQVEEIKANVNGLTQYQLADLYGVKRPCIWKIQRGKLWRLHVPEVA
jgi:hypothetical protein